jgi:hypothetical protein
VWGIVNNIYKGGGEVGDKRGQKLRLKKSGHRAHELDITCGRKMRCGEGLGSVWGEADQTVEVVGGGYSRLREGRILTPRDTYGVYTVLW